MTPLQLLLTLLAERAKACTKFLFVPDMNQHLGTPERPARAMDDSRDIRSATCSDASATSAKERRFYKTSSDQLSSTDFTLPVN